MDFYVTSQIPKDLAKKSFSAGIALRMPGGQAPLFAMSGLAKKKSCLNIEHGYWSKQYDYPAFKLSADVTSSSTDITLGSTSDWQTPNNAINPGNDLEGTALPARGSIKDITRVIPGMILRHMADTPAGTAFAAPELMLVTSVNVATNVMTVERGFAGTTAKAMTSGSLVIVVGNAHEEASKRPQSQTVLPVRHLNYTQIFRNSWDISGTLAAVAMNQGIDNVSMNKNDCIHMHARDIETAAWFSRKHMGTKNGNPFHTMDGIEALIEKYAPNNLHWADATGGEDYDSLVKMVNPLLDWKTDQQGSNRRVIYAGGEAFQTLQDIGRKSGQYQLVDGQTNYGLQFKRFTTGRGTFDMIENPLFNTNPQWSKMAAVLDLGQFDFCYLRDTRHDQYNQFGGLTDGVDATGGVLTTELTLEMQAPFTCGIIYNLTKAK